MKIDFPKQISDPEILNKGRLAIGLVAAIVFSQDLWYVIEHGVGNPSLDSGRWSWVQHFLTRLFGHFGPPIVKLFFASALVIPAMCKLWRAKKKNNEN